MSALTREELLVVARVDPTEEEAKEQLWQVALSRVEEVEREERRAQP